MIRENLEFFSEQDGLRLDGLLIAPEEKKAILQISHGMCEHKERYIPFMEYMAGQGYLCVIHDHRGHGKSVRSKEDLGYFYQNGGESLVEDLHQITKQIKGQYPKLPYFLLGHSMGSLAVRCYIKKYDDELDGLVVCGSPSENAMAGVGMKIDKVIQKYRGEHGRSSVIDKVFSKGFEKAFEEEHIPHAWICSDKEVVAAYNADPLCNFTFTLNGYEALLWLVRQTYSVQGWEVKYAELPISFISGEEDPCMVDRKKFFEAVEHLKRIGYTKVSGKLYPKMRHELLNEIGKETVYKEITAFFDSILESGK